MLKYMTTEMKGFDKNNFHMMYIVRKIILEHRQQREHTVPRTQDELLRKNNFWHQHYEKMVKYSKISSSSQCYLDIWHNNNQTGVKTLPKGSILILLYVFHYKLISGKSVLQKNILLL